MKIRALVIIGLLAAIVALPITLRRQSTTRSASQADDTLVIITPQNQSIQQEFGEAFAAYWKKSTGRSLHIDWRSPGGASEIRMVLDAGFKAAQDTQRDGIGMDVFFGGGEPDFTDQAKKGRLVPLRVFDTHPEYFGKNGPIPEMFTGERFYAADHVWVSTCISQFGICYNPHVLTRLKIPCPVRWQDLTHPNYAGNIALADPTKSASVARSFELVVQGEMFRAIAENPNHRQAALKQGWTAGLQLIQRMAANARYFTDSASKIPQDVGQGNAAAGMCIDFYGRSYANDLTSPDGSARVVWVAPIGGSSLSPDPVGILKGAPHMDVAQSFVEFCLSREAQLLWFSKPGTPGGPKERALHRMPIRRDLYSADILSQTTMPGINPYQDSGNFIYQPELTSKAFNTLRQIVRVMCIDSHEEMKAAWSALRAAGMPQDALTVFSDVSTFPYSQCVNGDPGFNAGDPLKSAAYAAQTGEWFRANYRKAKAMAENER